MYRIDHMVIRFASRCKRARPLKIPPCNLVCGLQWEYVEWLGTHTLFPCILLIWALVTFKPTITMASPQTTDSNVQDSIPDAMYLQYPLDLASFYYGGHAQTTERRSSQNEFWRVVISACILHDYRYCGIMQTRACTKLVRQWMAEFFWSSKFV